MDVFESNSFNEQASKTAYSTGVSKKHFVVFACVLSAVVLCFNAIVLAVVFLGGQKKELSTQDVVARVAPYIVEIDTGSYGSGIIVDFEGNKPIILTSYHLGNLSSAKIKLFNQGYSSAAVSVLGYDEYYDLAVLRLEQESKRLAPLSFFDGTPANGSKAILLGNGSGKGTAVGEGIVSNNNAYVDYLQRTLSVLQTSAPVNSGFSGGGLFDAKGNLIGVAAFKAETYGGNYVDGVSYCISANIARAVYRVIRKSGGGGQVQLPSVQYEKTGLVLIDELDVGLSFNGAEWICVPLSVDSEFSAGEKLYALGGFSGKNGNASALIAHVYKYNAVGEGGVLVVKTNSQQVTFDALRFV